MTTEGYEIHKSAIKKYLSEKVEDIKIRVPKDDKKSNKDYFKTMADKYGMSLNQFAIESMKYCIDNKVFKKSAAEHKK
ncbi:MAG: hypothetical protein E7309_16185 [Butyrivibrio sp.]|jgi:hypothetical protein|nr:hypothetical protein [Butyrivibrio sp.]